ncbi:hypothetical protein V6N13_046256 [Hibiscus sabdariffa]|uniref:Uncharacterized protein n=1 Tax=Hibiscus sabdariffa TaxID=183260 RepID=A0ABR1ZZ36_9ROSI
MHPAAGTGYEIVGPLEAFNNPIDGKGKELSIIGRQWKIVIQGRNSKVFIDLKFLSNNWLDFQPLKNILIRGLMTEGDEGAISGSTRLSGDALTSIKGLNAGGVLDLWPGIQLLKYWMLSWLGGLARPKLDIDRLALDPLDRGSGTDSYGYNYVYFVGLVDMPSIYFDYKWYIEVQRAVAAIDYLGRALQLENRTSNGTRLAQPIYFLIGGLLET